MNVQVLVRNEPHLCQSLRKCRDLLAFEASLCGFQREDSCCQPSPPIHTHTHTLCLTASATRASASTCCVYVCMWGVIGFHLFMRLCPGTGPSPVHIDAYTIVAGKTLYYSDRDGYEYKVIGVSHNSACIQKQPLN